MYVFHHTLVIIAWLAEAGGCCMQQRSNNIQEVSVHSNLIEELNDGFDRPFQ